MCGGAAARGEEGCMDGLGAGMTYWSIKGTAHQGWPSTV